MKNCMNSAALFTSELLELISYYMSIYPGHQYHQSILYTVGGLRAMWRVSELRCTAHYLYPIAYREAAPVDKYSITLLK